MIVCESGNDGEVVVNSGPALKDRRSDMRRFQQGVAVAITGIAGILGWSSTAEAQVSPGPLTTLTQPFPVSFPSSSPFGSIFPYNPPPTPQVAFPLTQANLSFDNVLNPQNSFGAIFPGSTVLSPLAQQFSAAFDQARQETALCIQYLVVNRDNILHGRDATYNSIFGNFYDPASESTFLHTINLSHYDRVLSTLQTMQNLMTHPTQVNVGLPFQQTMTSISGTNNTTVMVPPNTLQPRSQLLPGVPQLPGAAGAATANTKRSNNPATWGTIFGLDYGLRHWGYSNSDSIANFDQAVPGGVLVNVGGNIATQPPPGPSLRWDADTTPYTSPSIDPTLLNRLVGTPLPYSYHPNGDFSAFFNEKLDIAMRPDIPGAPQQTTNTLWLGAVFFGQEERTSAPPSQTSTTPPTAIFNSGSGNTGLNAADFKPASMQQYQMIMAAFSEFTASLNDPRGGAYAGVFDIVHSQDPNEDMFVKAIDSSSFAKFADALNKEGLKDLRDFPPVGKQGHAGFVSDADLDPFTPIVPPG